MGAVRLKTMKFKIHQFLTWVVFGAVAGVAGTGAQTLRTVDAGGGLYLNQIGDRAAVREPSGGVSELTLPEGTTFRQIQPLKNGWIAAGEIEVPGAIDLFLVLDKAGERQVLPPPPSDTPEPLRAGPAPLVENGELAGLAWLAGDRIKQTAVWASRWSGLEWSQPELVSPVGPGTQIAIDGAVLPDGSWLVIWSRYDGHDDEIVWSRRGAEGWSEPSQLHEPNEFPDIRPSLVATGRGALAAWSGWDGESYRVRLAAFEDDAWRDLAFDSPLGAVRPGLTLHNEGALLLYRTVVSAAWRLHELDDRGAVLRSAVVEMQSSTRPGVAPGAGVPALEWPGEQVEVPLRVQAEWQVEP